MAAKKTQTSDQGPDNSHVNRVAPYPFKIEVLASETALPIVANIMKITDQGFLMRLTAPHHFIVGQAHLVRFSLPVDRGFVNTSVRVVKTYDSVQAINAKEFAKVFTIEMHFTALSKENREQILKFIKAIGQK
jgi:hypothetical protein